MKPPSRVPLAFDSTLASADPTYWPYFAPPFFRNGPDRGHDDRADISLLVGPPDTAAESAAVQVMAARDDPVERLALATRTYHGPTGRAPRHLPYKRAAMSFMRWQAERGVLDPSTRRRQEALVAGGQRAATARWVRSRGAVEWPARRAVVADHRGLDGLHCKAHAAELVPAHNASIVAAYLEHPDLAGQESMAERFFLNVVLLRVLFAHALVAAPRMALGYLAPSDASSATQDSGWREPFSRCAECFRIAIRWRAM